jgi:hypothetical protein
VVANGGPNIGHNGAPEPTVEERKKQFTEEIALWVGNQRLDAALAREELAQLEGVQRFLALCKNLLVSVITICRRHKRADTRTAVMTLVSFLSDNGNGTCVLSCVRMGKLLHRHERNIREAINGLEDDGLIGVDRTAEGFPRAYWPMVPRAIPEMNPASAWFVDALSDKPARRGRPRLVEKTPGADARPFSAPCQKTSGAVVKTPGAKEHSISLLQIATDDGDRLREDGQHGGEYFCSSSQAWEDSADKPTEATRLQVVQHGSAEDQSTPPRWMDDLVDKHAADFGFLATFWNRASNGKPIDRAFTDTNLRGHLRARAATHAPAVIQEGLPQTLLRMRAMWQKQAEAGTQRGAASAGGFQGYFTKTLRTTCEDIVKLNKKSVIDEHTESEVAAVRIEAEQQIADRRVTAFDKATEQNASTRAARGKQVKTAPRMSHQQIIDAARERGGDENGLVHLAWRLLALPNRERDGDPVLWACDLSHEVKKFDPEVLQRMSRDRSDQRVVSIDCRHRRRLPCLGRRYRRAGPDGSHDGAHLRLG